MKAVIRKAIPAQKRLPVKSQTTKAITAAGSMKSKILTTKIMVIIPIMSNRKSKTNSYMEGSWKYEANIPLYQIVY